MRNIIARATLLAVLAVFFNGMTSQLHAQQPIIKVIDRDAPPNETIRIIGGGFSEQKEDLVVYFGAVKGEISYASNTVLEVIVPVGATYAPLSVTHLKSGLTGYSILPFNLAFGGIGLSESSFGSQLDFNASPGIHNIFLGDLNGDLKTDVVASHISGNFITVYPNRSDLENIDFSAAIPVTVGSPTSSIICSDLTGDGKQDIIAASSQESKIYILKNNSTAGNFDFESPIALDLSHAPTEIAIGDLNSDGKPEIVVSHKTSNTITILKNSSGPETIKFTLDTELTIAEADGSSALVISDLNRDGMPDIVMGQATNTGSGIFVFQNQSLGSDLIFSNERRYEVPINIANMASVDIDGDKRPDIVGTTPGTNKIYILLNNTIEAGNDIELSSAIGLTTAAGPVGIAIGDLDGRGGPDIMVVTSSNNITVFKNSSTPGILSLQQFDLPTNESNQSIKSGDINGDGKPDIIFTSVDSPKLSILPNQTCLMPQITPTGPLTICQGSVVKLEAIQLPGVTYTWKKDNTVVKSGGEAFIAVQASGSYELETSGLCGNSSGPVEVTVVSGDIPPVGEVSSNSPVCQGVPLQLFASDVPDATYEWSGPGNFTSNEQNPVIENFSQAHAGRYFLQIVHGDCKSAKVSTVVEVVGTPPPAVSATADKSKVSAGETVQLTASGAFIYHWFPETGLSNPNIANPIATIDSTITYTVTGEDVNGCPASAEITITVENTLNVQPRNLFSPNGDRIDDYWQVEGIEGFPYCTVTIFNRQGIKVFEDRPYTNDWDGTYNGVPLPQGVYYYVIRCNGEKNGKAGSITLIR